MKPVSLKEIKLELENCTPKELLEMCLRLAKFKKDNKELLTFLLFESPDELMFIKGVKEEIDQQFELINRTNYYYIKKSVRKILANIKKNVRYSTKKETEVELLIYFCTKLRDFRPSVQKNTRLLNIYSGQIDLIRKKISLLHEDLQYDYGIELEKLNKNAM